MMAARPQSAIPESSDPSFVPRDLFPNALQLSILRTACCADEDLNTYWNNLRTALAHVDPDFQSAELLSLLHRRLSRDRADALSNTVRARYRQTWATNQLTFQALQSCLQILHAARIRTLVLKGAALLMLYYKDMGSRSMGDFDILIPQVDFETAVDALIDAGWTPMSPVAGFDARFIHSFEMKDPQGNVLDLHTHVLHFTPRHDADEFFWKTSIPIRLQSIETRTLSGAALIVHLAVHAFRWSLNPQVRWVPDVAKVLSSEETDWEELLSLTRYLRASIAVRTILEYLVKQGFATVPKNVLSDLKSTSIQPDERRSFELGSQDTFNSLYKTAQFHWHIMTHQEGGRSLYSKLRLTPAYISHCMKKFELGSPLGLFGRALFKRFMGKLGRYKRPSTNHRLR